MLPWFDRPIIYDVRARPSLIQSQSGSRDLQMVRNTETGGSQRSRGPRVVRGDRAIRVDRERRGFRVFNKDRAIKVDRERRE
jgi:hypothetical protein